MPKVDLRTNSEDVVSDLFRKVYTILTDMNFVLFKISPFKQRKHVRKSLTNFVCWSSILVLSYQGQYMLLTFGKKFHRHDMSFMCFIATET